MNPSYKNIIDVNETIEEALDEGYFFIMDNYMYKDMLYCGDKGLIMQPSLFIDNSGCYLITKITKQIQLDFYINKNGKMVRIKPAYPNVAISSN